MKTNFWKKLKTPILALAPMAGITDSPFRQICKSFGADLVYTEMVSADGLVYGSKKTLDLMKFDKSEKPIILQLFGKKPENFIKAIRNEKLETRNFDGVDINMGCPARKVVNSGHGIALMNDAKLAGEIVRALKESTRLPVSVKMRLGIKNKNEILTFGPKMEKAGADALCVHARTYKQGFSGPIDFGIMKQLKKKIKIPLIVSGGVYSVDDAKKTVEQTGADGIMLGQGVFGRPWLFREIKSESTNVSESTKTTNATNDVNWDQVKKTALKHAKLAYKCKGDHGIIEMRKHLAWYVKGRPDARELRRKLVRVESLQEIEKIFSSEL